jgi:hypothetical protein
MGQTMELAGAAHSSIARSWTMISLPSLLRARLRPRLLECARRGGVLADAAAFVEAHSPSSFRRFSFVAGETLDMVTGIGNFSDAKCRRSS